jgi:hypothetical protein
LLVAIAVTASLTTPTTSDGDQPSEASTTQCNDVGAADVAYEGSCRGENAVLTVARGHHELELTPLAVRLLTARVRVAATPTGKRRHRIRLTVKLRLRNTGNRTLTLRPGELYLNLNGRRILPDAHHRATEAPVLGVSIPPRGLLKGTARFELGGSSTEAYRRQEFTELRVGAAHAPRSSPERIGLIRFTAERDR